MCDDKLKLPRIQVVPFSPFAGLLEWVEQTVPLSDYLLGTNKSGGAHLRFRPDDWSFNQCFKKLSKAAPNKKLDAFETVHIVCGQCHASLCHKVRILLGFRKHYGFQFQDILICLPAV